MMRIDFKQILFSHCGQPVIFFLLLYRSATIILIVDIIAGSALLITGSSGEHNHFAGLLIM